MNFHEKMFSEMFQYFKKSSRSRSNLRSKMPDFLKNWTKITGHEKMVCHTLGSRAAGGRIGQKPGSSSSSSLLGFFDPDILISERRD